MSVKRAARTGAEETPTWKAARKIEAKVETRLAGVDGEWGNEQPSMALLYPSTMVKGPIFEM
jgi:hypothetical protein